MINSAQELYQRQDHLLDEIEKRGVVESPYILAGGTALARGYLHHRISYDLDFFIDGKFSPEVLQGRLYRAGIPLQDVEMQSSDNLAHELHGIVAGAPPVKISFIEDPFATMFKTALVDGFKTEVLEGLYHRKVRTVSGTYNAKGSPAGARQTARDLFDLYVLHREVKPILDFVMEINSQGAGVPEDGLLAGFRSMPWRELMAEYEALVRAERFQGITLQDIKRHFDQSFGFKALKP
jgi:hypothetical protein